MSALHVVSFHAHPDDAEILCAGTLALLAQRGHRITIVTMTPGDKGSMVKPPEEIAAIRRAEAEKAAALIGANYRCAEFRDLEVFSDHSSRKRVVELLRCLQPDLVLTSSPVDYLCDHEATSALVRDACFAAPCANYFTGAEPAAPPLLSIPHLYFMDPIGGVDREGKPVLPDFVVNVESTLEIKTRMLEAHDSQRSWLKMRHGMDDYILSMQSWTRSCGARAGFRYGEGFRHYKGHPYPETPLLQDLLEGLWAKLP
ncbi:MAG: PIG-L family deacetylase [Bryobacteraceae bacterium]|nr:PIG-L family deacetylase [Bryobacteraceae bacterium]MDW8377901.1 PIG-L family deacetylase [Bryobacterales bacterium]